MDEKILYMLQLLLLIFGTSTASEYHCGHENTENYSNEWLVRLEGGPEIAELLAIQLGYKYVGLLICLNSTGVPSRY
ncbi:hypothetical protein L9F63_009648, partial [Diploptera punctata]